MSELSPEAHRRIRRQLAMIPVYVWLAFGWHHVLFNVTQHEPVRDLAQFYIQGVIAREGNSSALYDPDAMTAIGPRVLPDGLAPRYPTVYGPQISVFFLPMTYLPYMTAVYLWLLATTLVFAWCCYALWRACPRVREPAWVMLLLGLAAPMLFFTLAFVQISAIGLVCVTAAYFALRAGRPLLAGIAIGCLAYKPPLGLVVAVVFVFAREWRVVLGAAAAAAAQLAIGALYWGPGILVAYAQALMRIPGIADEIEPFRYQMHSWRAFFDLLQLPAGVSLAAYAVAAALTTLLALRCWRAQGPLALRYSAILIATVLVDPHLYAYDLLLLTPAFFLVWDWLRAEPERSMAEVFPRLDATWIGGWPFGRVVGGLLLFCYASPLFGALAAAARVQLSVPALAALGFVIVHRLLSPPRVADLPLRRGAASPRAATAG